MFFILLFSLDSVNFTTIDQWPLNKYDIVNSVTFSVSDNGIVAIIDKDDKQIVFIDTQGKLIRRSGRKGEGPGEFLYPPEVKWNTQDRVFAVYDEIRSRISTWDEEGNMVKEFPVPRYRWMENLQYLDKPGDIIFTKFIMGYEKETPTLMIYNAKSKESKVLWQHKMKKPRLGTANTKRGPFGMVNDFHSRLLYGLGNGFVAVTFSDTNQIHLIDFNGKQISKPFAPKLPSWPLTKELIEQWLASHEPFVRRLVTMENLDTPEFYPSVGKIVVDKQDRIWVFGFPRNMKGDYPFRVFSKKGEALTLGKIPERAQEFVGDFMYYLTEIEDMLFLERTKIIFTK